LVRLVILTIAFGWFRFFTAMVVRTSIDTSIRIAMNEIMQHDDDVGKTVVIGFSWGGAVSTRKSTVHISS
jgi:hypothetical protein